MWACGFGNHLTIVGILPAAVIYGIVKDRSVLRPRVAITAAIIGLIGVAQYWFIAIRTMQGAPYLEARADTIQGVFDVIIARDVSWARFYQAQSAVAAIEVPMLLNGIRIHMGTIPIIAGRHRDRHRHLEEECGGAADPRRRRRHARHDRQPVGRRRRLHHAGVRAVVAAGGPRPAMADHGRPAGQPTFAKATVGRQANGPTMLTAAGVVAMLLPLANVISNRSAIEALRTPGEGPGVRALYAKLPARSALVAENYWLARLVNYMHFSGEYQPDPNPRVLDSDINDVKAAVADGLEVYAFEGATQWLNAQGLRFEKTDVARQPFETWLAQPAARHADRRGQRRAAAADRMAAGPSTTLGQAAGAQSGGRANYGAFAWSVGDTGAHVAQQDSLARIDHAVGAEGRVLTIVSSDEGPQIVWGDDVLTAIDRGLAVAAFSPAGQPDRTVGVRARRQTRRAIAADSICAAR